MKKSLKIEHLNDSYFIPASRLKWLIIVVICSLTLFFLLFAALHPNLVSGTFIANRAISRLNFIMIFAVPLLLIVILIGVIMLLRKLGVRLDSQGISANMSLKKMAFTWQEISKIKVNAEYSIIIILKNGKVRQIWGRMFKGVPMGGIDRKNYRSFSRQLSQIVASYSQLTLIDLDKQDSDVFIDE